MKQWLTIAEYAEIEGISKQAVYKALKTRLKTYVDMVDGVKMINSNALKDISNNHNKTTNVEQKTTTDRAILELIEQLRIKDNQINQLNNRLEQALQVIRENQMITAITAGNPIDKPDSNQVKTEYVETDNPSEIWQTPPDEAIRPDDITDPAQQVRDVPDSVTPEDITTGPAEPITQGAPMATDENHEDIKPGGLTTDEPVKDSATATPGETLTTGTAAKVDSPITDHPGIIKRLLNKITGKK